MKMYFINEVHGMSAWQTPSTMNENTMLNYSKLIIRTPGISR